MNIKVIVNPRAGGGKGRYIGLKVEQFLCDRGIQYSLDSTFKPGGAVSLSKKAIEDGFDLIIGIGGDGTMNEIANGIIGSKTALAVIPAGHHNNFSRSLGLEPSDTTGALETALYGRTIEADTGKFNGRYFLNGISIGLTAEEKSSTFPALPIIGKQSLYLIKLFRKLFGFKAPKLLIKMGGLELHSKALMTKISNGGYFAGGFNIVPHACLQDGLLDICVLSCTGKLGFLRNASKAFQGRHNRSFPMSTFRSDQITIESPDPLDVSCDGEAVPAVMPFKISVSRKKIPVKIK
ncbi:MAG: diacylglycerol kinase family protein [Candidatus Margulisiibacteriota bacterium]